MVTAAYTPNRYILYYYIYNNRSTVSLNSEREKRGQNDIVYECTGYTAIGWSDRHFAGQFQISLPIVHITFIHIYFFLLYQHKCVSRKLDDKYHFATFILLSLFFSIKFHSTPKARTYFNIIKI